MFSINDYLYTEMWREVGLGHAHKAGVCKKKSEREKNEIDWLCSLAFCVMAAQFLCTTTKGCIRKMWIEKSYLKEIFRFYVEKDGQSLIQTLTPPPPKLGVRGQPNTNFFLIGKFLLFKNV
jgi:hypothetical protein